MDLTFAISANIVNVTETFNEMKEAINGVIKTYSTDNIKYSVIVYGANVTVQLRFNEEFPTSILLQVRSLLKMVQKIPKLNIRLFSYCLGLIGECGKILSIGTNGSLGTVFQY